jgi:hypothetical protein
MTTEHNTDTYESANEALLFCKMYLEEKGLADAAIYLEGLDHVCDHRTGRVAWSCLVAASQRVNDVSAMHFVTLALNAVERALQAPVLLAAS